MYENDNYIISHVVKSDKPNNGDDLISIKYEDNFAILLLADGATGIGYGKNASSILGEVFTTCYLNCYDFDEAVSKMEKCLFLADAEIRNRNIDGDTTGILLAINRNTYAITSVGDSEAWMQKPSGLQYLSYKQNKKPRIGSGAIIHKPEIGIVEGPILLCSDGLRHALSDQNDWFKCADNPKKWANNLLDNVLIKCDNQLPDDLSVITVVFK